MFYFNTLPKLLTPDQNGNYILMTNILTRAKLIEELQGLSKEDIIPKPEKLTLWQRIKKTLNF